MTKVKENIHFKSFSRSGNLFCSSKNILQNKVFVGAQGAGTTQDEHTSYDYTKLTDGIIDIDVWYNGRFSSTFNGFADGTVELGETYNLTEVRFYCYQG